MASAKPSALVVARVLVLHGVIIAFLLLLSGCTGGKVSEMTAQLKDDSGNAVSDAEVNIKWTTNQPWGPSLRSGDPHYLNRTSDVDGRFSFRLSNQVTFLGITKAGHYPTSLSLYPDHLPQMPVMIPLRRILRPQPMVGKQVLVTIPAGSFHFEYDLLAGDCLPPYGKGSNADLGVEWRRPDQSKGEYPRDVISVQVLGKENGVFTQRIKSSSNAPRSALPSYYEAPVAGYVATFAEADQAAGGIKGEYDGASTIYYFKIRSERPSGPLFGKLRGEILYFPRPNREKDQFKFEYVINLSGDRGMEIDMKRITVPSPHELEYPPEEF